MTLLSTDETFLGLVPCTFGLLFEVFELFVVVLVLGFGLLEMVFLLCFAGTGVFGFALDLQRRLLTAGFISSSFS